MTLQAGTRLGSYDILVAIGAGGMGEVYRVRDTRLNRDVAIKVRPEDFAFDANRRARFEREAQAVAALSHPNMLAIRDFGVQEGMAYAVPELLDGETLRERVQRGALPVKKAIEVAGVYRQRWISVGLRRRSVCEYVRKKSSRARACDHV